MYNIHVNTSVYVEIRDINEDRHVIPLNNKSHPHPLISLQMYSYAMNSVWQTTIATNKNFNSRL